MYHIKYTTLNIRKGMENYQMMRKTAANQQGCPSDVGCKHRFSSFTDLPDFS